MYKYFLSLLLLLIVPLLVYAQDKTAMESNYKNVVSALDNGQLDKLDDYIAIDAIDHDIDPSMTQKTGLAAIKEMFAYYHKIFPDMKTNIHKIATSGDMLFAYITMTGTTSEPFMGMPADYKMSMDGVDIIRFKDGKAVEHWGFTSNTDMMKMMPPPDEMKEK